MSDKIRCELMTTTEGLVPIFMWGKYLNTKSYDGAEFADVVMEAAARNLLRSDGSYMLVKAPTRVFSPHASEYYCLPEDSALILACLFEETGKKTVPVSHAEKYRRDAVVAFATLCGQRHAVDAYISQVETLFQATREAGEPVRATAKRRRADLKDVVEMIETANLQDSQQEAQALVQAPRSVSTEPDSDNSDTE
jgi:hypothetical protein